MQKIEITLSGLEEERCAALIERLADETISKFDVSKIQGYCGKAPVRKGNSELLVPEFMKCRRSDKKRSWFARKEG